MKLTGVGKRFGSRIVLRDVSLEIFPGTVTLLAGANGAGKTTLMRLMAGLARPDAGSVTRTFEDEAATDREQETGVGYLGHATFLYPGLSALENLAFWGRLHGRDTSEAALLDVLRRVELKRWAAERAGAFSRGMAQRLNLARILLLRPRLLLLDEPGTGLDNHSQGMLRAEIADARARGAAVVWISHDIRDDAVHADRLLSLAERRIAYDGKPDAFLSGPPGKGQGEACGTTPGAEETACPKSA